MEICYRNFAHHLLGGGGVHHVGLPLGVPTFLVGVCYTTTVINDNEVA